MTGGIKMRKRLVLSSMFLFVFVLASIGLSTSEAHAGLVNRKGTWKEEYEESVGGKILTTRDRCKWSIWKSECSSAGDGETKDEKVYTL